MDEFKERLLPILEGAECCHCGADTHAAPGYPTACHDCREQDAIDQHALKVEEEML